MDACTGMEPEAFPSVLDPACLSGCADVLAPASIRYAPTPLSVFTASWILRAESPVVLADLKRIPVHVVLSSSSLGCVFFYLMCTYCALQGQLWHQPRKLVHALPWFL